MRYTQSQVPVCSFPMATSETYKDRNSGERITQTEWHNIVLWRGLAETANQYLRKGSQVYIEGKLQTRSWEDQSGQKRYTTEIVADVMQFLDRPSEGGSHRAPHPAEAADAAPQSTAAPTPESPAPDLEPESPF
jgi:single-strand DNA-binding protein